MQQGCKELIKLNNKSTVWKKRSNRTEIGANKCWVRDQAVSLSTKHRSEDAIERTYFGLHLEFCTAAHRDTLQYAHVDKADSIKPSLKRKARRRALNAKADKLKGASRNIVQSGS